MSYPGTRTVANLLSHIHRLKGLFILFIENTVQINKQAISLLKIDSSD